jgi:hypothetical protein
MSEQGKKRTPYFKLLNIAILVATIVSLSLTITAVFWEEYYPFTRPLTPQEAQAYLEKEFASRGLTSELELLRKEVEALSNLPSADPVNIALQKFEVRLDSLSDRIKTFERIVADDSTRVLELALIGRDVNDIEERMNTSQTVVRSELDRIYAQNNWFIGIMITTLLGMIGLVATNLGKQSRKSE